MTAEELASAKQLIAAKQTDAAALTLRRHLVTAPADAEAHHLLSMLLFEAGRLYEAEANYRCFVAYAPRDVRATYGLGMTLLQMRRLDEARQWMEATLVIDPGFTRATERLRQISAAQPPPADVPLPPREGSAPARPLTTMIIPTDSEIAEYRRRSRQKMRADLANQAWHGVPWPLRLLQTAIVIAFIAAAIFLVPYILGGF